MAIFTVIIRNTGVPPGTPRRVLQNTHPVGRQHSDSSACHKAVSSLCSLVVHISTGKNISSSKCHGKLYSYTFIHLIYTGTTKTSMSQPRIRFGGLPKLHSARSKKMNLKKDAFQKSGSSPQSFYFGGHFRPFSPC